MKEEGKFYFKYRGNGYGPFDNEEEAKSAARKKNDGKYNRAWLWFGIPEIDSNKNLIGGDIRPLKAFDL